MYFGVSLFITTIIDLSIWTIFVYDRWRPAFEIIQLYACDWDDDTTMKCVDSFPLIIQQKMATFDMDSCHQQWLQRNPGLGERKEEISSMKSNWNSSIMIKQSKNLNSTHIHGDAMIMLFYNKFIITVIIIIIKLPFME